jgi:phage/conjugal plasmid C-4 type zinc finger TraR family protein
MVKGAGLSKLLQHILGFMMNKYSDNDNVDDETLHTVVLVENQIALVRSKLPTGPGLKHCLSCGDEIPALRRSAIPGTRYCIDCQTEHDNYRLRSATSE